MADSVGTAPIAEKSRRLPATLSARWFWYSVLCVLCWGAWALLAKLGSTDISASTSQYLYNWGALPVAVAVLMVRRFRLEPNVKGISYSVANGVLSGIGSLALFAAYRTGGNTSVITAATALYPMITVVLAITFLRERLTRLQVLGLAFAAVAIVIFSK